MMTVYGRMLLAAAGSALLLLGALAFQYVGGLAPCPMCLWQRWPHLLAVLVGILGVTVLWRQRRWLALAGAALMTASAGLAIFHAGVEWRWWEGLSTCSAPAPGSDVSADALLEQILEAPVVRCDDVAWSMLGLSLAGWNALLSAGLAALWAASVWWWRMPFDREA